jgi:hypothetical protein
VADLAGVDGLLGDPEGLGHLDLGDVLALARLRHASAEAHEEVLVVFADTELSPRGRASVSGSQCPAARREPSLAAADESGCSEAEGPPTGIEGHRLPSVEDHAPLRPWSFWNGDAPIAGAPYSALRAVSYFDGKHLVHNYSGRFFRDSQGRTRTESAIFPADATTSGPPPAHALITISDPLRGHQYVLHQEYKYADVERWWRSDSILPTPVTDNTPSACKTTPLGEKVIDGIKVVGTWWKCDLSGLGEGKLTVEETAHEDWFSPDLGVVLLAVRRSLSNGGVLTYKLEHIVRGEPDPNLFKVPSGYNHRNDDEPEEKRAVLEERVIVGEP